MPPSSVRASRWPPPGLWQPSFWGGERFSSTQIFVMLLFLAPLTVQTQAEQDCQELWGASLVPVVIARRPRQVESRWKAAAFGCLGKTAVEDPGSGMQEPEPCPKLFSEQLQSTQYVKGWLEKPVNIQVCLSSLRAEDWCQQPITCLLSS